MDAELAGRLRVAGVDPDRISDPSAAYRALFLRFGARATLLDRYQLEEAHRQISIHDLSRDERTRIWLEVESVRNPNIELLGTGTGEPIEVVEYDPQWPKVFERWRGRLKAALGNEAISIHHIGSTAVPGLAAKPIVDVLVCMRDVESETTYVEQIGSLGVLLRMREPGHRFLRPAKGQARTVHIHVCQAGSEWERVHLAFRDVLRSHPDLAADYASIKRTLAITYEGDRMAYNEAKTVFILDALESVESSPRNAKRIR